MGRPSQCDCKCQPRNNYCDFRLGTMPSTNYTYFNNVYDPDYLSPAALSDLDDCNCYLLACFGRPRRSGSSYADMYLTAPELAVLADWVVAGGKLIFTIDYDTLTVSGAVLGRECDATYIGMMNAFLADCGSTLSVGTYSPTSSGGWSSGSFSTSYPLTSGLTGPVWYDGGGLAGGSLSGGTTVFSPTSQMVVAYEELSGGGLIVGTASQNVFWGKTDEGTSGNASMISFHERIRDL